MWALVPSTLSLCNCVHLVNRCLVTVASVPCHLNVSGPLRRCRCYQLSPLVTNLSTTWVAILQWPDLHATMLHLYVTGYMSWHVTDICLDMLQPYVLTCYNHMSWQVTTICITVTKIWILPWGATCPFLGVVILGGWGGSDILTSHHPTMLCFSLATTSH